MRAPEPDRADPADVPVFILCGGMGTRLGDGAGGAPKPMLEIGGRPMVMHVMGCYGRHGFRRFVLCTGHRSEAIEDYFLNFAARSADFTVGLADRSVSFHQRERAPDWEVTLAYTGARTMTGGRVARAARRYLGDAPHFAVTYGDGLTDADLGAELAWHLAHDRTATALGAEAPSTFGRFELDEDGGASAFVEKPRRAGGTINGGFFLFRRRFLDYLSAEEGCVLEGLPLQRLVAEGQLRVFRHSGFWSCVDTVRDRDEVRGLWEAGAAPWGG
jgi:glucose-1-phosphate cytidylyltransferase